MALYRIEIKTITRGEGRSAVAAAAYRSGKKIENRWDGTEHDYSHKSGIVYTEIMLPKNAPEQYRDRSELWNAVEMAEPSSRCRLARECLLALPVELTRKQQIELVRDFVKKNFVDIGMCADVAIHDPVETDDLNRPLDSQGNPTTDPKQFQHVNPHAHILLTVRPIGKDGKWEAKTQKEYVCRRGDEQKGFTGDEFKKAELQGWEKQFRYLNHAGEKVWLTPSEAKEQGLDISDRVTRSPRSTPHGRPNPTTAYWNDASRVREWRKAWEVAINDKFRELGIQERVDSRSYADQGMDRIPGVHMGSYVNTLEKRAKRLEREGFTAEHTDRGKFNRDADEYNKSAEQYHEAERAADKKIKTTAGRMEHLRAGMISNSITGEVIGKGLSAAMEMAKQKENDITTAVKTMETLAALNEQSLRSIEEIMKIIEILGNTHPRQRKEKEDQLAAERKKMSERTAYVDELLRQSGFSNAEDLRAAAEREEAEMEDLAEQKEAMKEMEQAAKEDAQEYKDLEKSIPEAFEKKVAKERKLARQVEEHVAKQKLKDKLKGSYSESEYERQAALHDTPEKTSNKQKGHTKAH